MSVVLHDDKRLWVVFLLKATLSPPSPVASESEDDDDDDGDDNDAFDDADRNASSTDKMST